MLKKGYRLESQDTLPIDLGPLDTDQSSLMDQLNLVKNVFGNLLVIQINILETKELYQDKTLPITYQLFVKLWMEEQI